MANRAPRQYLLKVTRGVRFAQSGEGREIRLRAGVPQAVVAATLDITQTTLSMWESGEQTPNSEHAAAYYDLISLLQRELCVVEQDDERPVERATPSGSPGSPGRGVRP